MKKRITSRIVIALLIVGAVAVLWAVLFYPHKSRLYEQLRIATATPGGTYYVLGEQLALILEQLPGTPIKSVRAERSRGSLENIYRLVESKADLALVQGPALVESETERELRVLARLYTDAVQIVVRGDSNIKTTDDFENFFKEDNNRRIYIGAESSGTRILANHILETAGLFEGDYTADDAESYADATKELVSEDLDAAIFAAGTPVPAVEEALKSGKCRLLSLGDELRKKLNSGKFNLREEIVPAYFYPHQPYRVETVGADVLLVCRKDLPKNLGFVIVDALFDKITELGLAHAKAQDIKPTTKAFDSLPKGFQLHSGAEDFKAQELEKLLIATGTLSGKYYLLGKTIGDFLEAWHIPARAIQTDGSLENADLLAKNRPTIAIMQYDAALACFGKPEFVYKADWSDIDVPEIPEMRNIRRIARLHEERVHVVVNRERLEAMEERLAAGARIVDKVADPGQESEQEIAGLDELLKALADAGDRITICPGPKGSGTQLVALTILDHHLESYTDQAKSLIRPLFLPVGEMADQLEKGKIDLGFFVGSVPSMAMSRLLDGDKVRLLSLGRKERGQMPGSVFKAAKIDANTYGCQQGYGPPIETLATQAVLVTTDALPLKDVKKITKAVFENLPYLNIAGLTKEDMAAIELDSPPLHVGAEEYYKNANLLLVEPSLLYNLRVTWTILGCLTMLVTVLCIPACTGLLVLRRNRTANEIGRRILAIPVEAAVQDSARRFIKIRDEIEDRVRRRWWRFGELDKQRWRYLHDLIYDRIGEAKENLTRTFVVEIRTVMNDSELSDSQRQQSCRHIENRVLELFAKGELDPSQQKMLRELLRETSRREVEPGDSEGEKKK